MRKQRTFLVSDGNSRTQFLITLMPVEPKGWMFLRGASPMYQGTVFQKSAADERLDRLTALVLANNGVMIEIEKGDLDVCVPMLPPANREEEPQALPIDVDFTQIEEPVQKEEPNGEAQPGPTTQANA